MHTIEVQREAGAEPEEAAGIGQERMPSIEGGGVLGVTVREPRRALDVFELPEGVTSVTMRSDEVTSNCPVTGQPDWYAVSIQLLGSRLGLESKSLKLYLQSFREDGQFCEQFAATIADDVKRRTQAARVVVEVVQRPRGGVSIDTTAER
jgi:7-cyano-7-deazaguanine reductase